MRKVGYLLMCPGPDLNRHGVLSPRDFKSLVSTKFHHPGRCLRRRRESNPRIKDLQSSPLATWVQRLIFILPQERWVCNVVRTQLLVFEQRRRVELYAKHSEAQGKKDRKLVFISFPNAGRCRFCLYQLFTM